MSGLPEGSVERPYRETPWNRIVGVSWGGLVALVDCRIAFLSSELEADSRLFGYTVATRPHIGNDGTEGSKPQSDPEGYPSFALAGLGAGTVPDGERLASFVDYYSFIENGVQDAGGSHGSPIPGDITRYRNYVIVNLAKVMRDLALSSVEIQFTLYNPGFPGVISSMFDVRVYQGGYFEGELDGAGNPTVIVNVGGTLLLEETLTGIVGAVDPFVYPPPPPP